jgi:hypothetical protein
MTWLSFFSSKAQVFVAGLIDHQYDGRPLRLLMGMLNQK